MNSNLLILGAGLYGTVVKEIAEACHIDCNAVVSSGALLSAKTRFKGRHFVLNWNQMGQ